MRLLRLNHIDLLRYAGLFTYACVGIPLVRLMWFPEPQITRFDHLGWLVAYAIFGISYWTLTRSLRRGGAHALKWSLLVVMTIAAAAISWFSVSGLAGILVLLIAGVLPWILPRWWGVLWLVAFSVLLVPVLDRMGNFGLFDSILQSMLYAGFSIYVFVTSFVAREQADAREEQRRLNAELRATRALLAESSRMAERVRISRELHDLLGHHLTALTLNLEVASHLVQERALDHVRQAQSLAKLLLTDVREVVSQLRQDDEIDLTRALRSLVEGIPTPKIHLDVPERFGVDDPRRAQVLLRCTQEIITNTIKHAHARNLWLTFERSDRNELVLHARDDGQGAADLKHGNGLTGMQERLGQFGGRLAIDTSRGSGFVLDAWLPAEAAA